MRTNAFIMVALLLANFAMAVGCGGGGGGGDGGGGGSTTFSCNLAASSFCFDEAVPAALTSAQVTQLQNTCTGGGGTFANGSTCPTANRAGTCALANTTGVTGVSVNERFYSPAFTASSAQTLCTGQGGTWTAG